MKFLSTISTAVVLLVISQASFALPYITGNVDITGNAVEIADLNGNFAGINWSDAA